MVDHSVAEAEDKILKSAPYFGSVLRKAGRSNGFLACNVNGTTMVVAVGTSGETLERMLLARDIFEPEDEVVIHRPPAVRAVPDMHEVHEEKPVVLIPRYHAPGGEFANKPGNVHLHVLHDATLGRRKRKSGECLCSKKKGSHERSPEPGETTVCTECMKVAKDNAIEWSLT